MPIVQKSVLVRHTPQQMYDLVDRVEDYPQFLPWCGGAELIERNATVTAARIHINFHGMRSQFATRNAKTAFSRMQIMLTEGPFRQLDGDWRFSALGESGCKVEFNLRYEFANPLLAKALGPVFAHIANTFVESFVKRAQQKYG